MRQQRVCREGERADRAIPRLTSAAFCGFSNKVEVLENGIDLEEFSRLRFRELSRASEANDHNKGHNQPEQENANDVVHGALAFPQPRNGARQQHNANANPERKNAWYPDANKQAVVPVNEKPERDAENEARECGDEERVIDLCEHRLSGSDGFTVERARWIQR